MFSEIKHCRMSQEIRNKLQPHVTGRRLSTLEPPFTNHTHTAAIAHAHGHVQKMFCRRHVHPLSEKNNVQSGSCRMRTSASHMAWAGGSYVCLWNSKRSPQQPHASLPRDVHGGVFLSYSILRLMRIGNLRASLRESSPDRDLLTKRRQETILATHVQ